MHRTQPISGRFQAMACPCEVLLDTDDDTLAASLIAIVQTEAQRIEAKFSRYREGTIVHEINSRQGQPMVVDEETAQLIDFAEKGYQMSGGLFDITTGVLRHVWRFDQKDNVPSKERVEIARQTVGWEKIHWQRPVLTLQPRMEIDMGGLAKEYAVDRALGLVLQQASIPVLINFGGDIAARGPQRDGKPWAVGVEDVQRPDTAKRIIYLQQGGLATSGDSKRYILSQGRRYGHILNPLSGYPVENAPRSVTVAADTCTQAGFLSTLGMLHGPNAESFLQDAGVRSWCERDSLPLSA